METVRNEKKALIISFHDFESTPSLAKLRAVSARARGEGADIVKIAAKTETPAEVARLLVLLQEAPGPLAVMGMGALGRASRLLFAKAGSALNYGWLDRPQVPGQWSAKEFRGVAGSRMIAGSGALACCASRGRCGRLRFCAIVPIVVRL